MKKDSFGLLKSVHIKPLKDSITLNMSGIVALDIYLNITGFGGFCVFLTVHSVIKYQTPALETVQESYFCRKLVGFDIETRFRFPLAGFQRHW